MNYKFSPPPYTYIRVLDVTSADWRCPNNVVICEVRTKLSGTVKITTRKNITARRFYDDYDIDRIDVLIIHTDTTSPTLRKNQITVAGHFREDLAGI